jgi:16S rRNA (guanine966-N2)-methyltransferase
MRIIAGNFKGIVIFGPKNKKIRPLKDMVRESIFNFLIHSNKIAFQIKGANILDLYSGTGSFGLECISREAANVIFIEKEKEAINLLEKNIQKLKVKNKTKIISGDVFNLINQDNKSLNNYFSNDKLDLIFCDPPFKNIKINDLIKLIISKNLLKKNGIIILHRHKKTNDQLSDALHVIDKRKYGLSKIIFGKPSTNLY